MVIGGSPSTCRQGDPGRNVKAKSGLNRSILDQGWGMFATMLGYKLVERGGKLLKVEAAYTSQTCPECGVVDATGRISRSEFVCVACDHSDHADIVAAPNVHQARILAVEPLERTLKRVGKRKRSKEAANAAAEGSPRIYPWGACHQC